MTQPAPPSPPSRPARERRERGLLAPSVTLLTVRGIRIGAHWSWPIVIFLVSWSLARDLFPVAYTGLSGTTYLVMAVVAALVFFVCILLHELGHAFQALKEGMKISDITLWLFGGVARFEGMFPSAGAEFRIAAAGPLVSIVLVALFGGLTWAGGLLGLPLPVLGVTDYLARINLAVVIFNLVPALPLDGGRILRSWLWGRKGDFTRATVSAAKAGMGFAWILIGVGLLEFAVFSALGGIWFVVMGWILYQAAQAEQSFAVLRQALRDVSVREIMTPDPVTVPSTLPVQELLERVHLRGHSCYPVVDDGQLKGQVWLRAAGQLAPDRRQATTVADVMTPAAVVPGDAPVVDVIDQLRAASGRAVVAGDGRVEGIVAMSDVARALQFRRTAAAERRRPRAWTLLLVAVAVLLPLGAALYRPPVVLVSPAPAVDISEDFEIDGVEVSDLNGRYILVAVHVIRPNGIRAVLSYFDPDVEMLPREALVPTGADEDDYLEAQRTVFDESRIAAAAAAAQAVGLEVELRGTGAEVLDVVPDSPADGNLRAGDVIVRAGDRTIDLVSDLVDITTVEPVGTAFELTVLRDDEEVGVEVRSARLSGFNAANKGIGIITTTRDLDVELPFEIEFRSRNIGGPSAGLVYALAIADLLDDADYAQGREIAASGTVQLDGRVGPVGSLAEKLVAAREADADLFLVPQDELDQIDGAARESGIATLGVDRLAEALESLRGRS